MDDGLICVGDNAPGCERIAIVRYRGNNKVTRH